jgi:hypothetical protein
MARQWSMSRCQRKHIKVMRPLPKVKIDKFRRWCGHVRINKAFVHEPIHPPSTTQPSLDRFFLQISSGFISVFHRGFWSSSDCERVEPFWNKSGFGRLLAPERYLIGSPFGSRASIPWKVPLTIVVYLLTITSKLNTVRKIDLAMGFQPLGGAANWTYSITHQ